MQLAHAAVGLSCVLGPLNHIPSVLPPLLLHAEQAKEAQHQADTRRLAQHYQGQLAAAEAEIQRVKAQGQEAAQGQVDALRDQLMEVKAAVAQRLAQRMAEALG